MLPDASLPSSHHHHPNNYNNHTITGSFSAADSCSGDLMLGSMGNNYNMEGHWRKHSSSSSSSSLAYTSPFLDPVGDGYNPGTNNMRRDGSRGSEDGTIKGVEFSVQFDLLKHSNTTGISRAHAPDLRIKIPKLGDGTRYGGGGGGGGASIISSTLPSPSINSSSESLNRTSGSTLTITEYHTDNTKPKRIESCVTMFGLNKVTLKKSFLDAISGIKSGFKARFPGVKNSSGGDGQDEEGLQKICYSLINLPDEEISTSRNCTVFKRQSLTLLVKALSNKQFELMLPSIPETFTSKGLESVLAGDAEEQGHGGSFERFLSMLPESCRDISEKASPLGLVPKLLPYGEISANARYIGSCFWMWLCITDDLTETLTGEAWNNAESDLLRIFSEDPQEETPPSSPPSTTSDIVQVSTALRTVIDETALHELPPTNGSNASNHMNDDNLWRPMFREAVREVIMGFRAERPLLGNNSTSKINLAEWMRVRIITISVRPFMIIARASLGLDPTLSPLGNPLAENYQDLLRTSKKSNRTNLAKVECLLQLIMGLQNDIIGWEKDHKTKTPLNTIQILIKDGKKPKKALAQVVEMHNELVEQLAVYGNRVWSEVIDLPPLTPSPYAQQFMNHPPPPPVHHQHHHHHGDSNFGNPMFTVHIPPPPLLLPPLSSDSISSGGGGGGGGGGLKVYGNHFCTTSNSSSWTASSSSSASSFSSLRNTGGGGDGTVRGDNRDSLLSTRRPGTSCSALASSTASNENLRKYLELAVGFSAGMASWMVDSRRYVV